MSEEKKGVTETKDVVIFLAKLGTSVAHCVINKKFIFSYFMDDIQALPGAIYGITEIPNEVKDLESQEAKELIESVLVELKDLGIDSNESAKMFVAAGINFAEGILNLISAIKGVKK